jgi:hypothetical protein
VPRPGGGKWPPPGRLATGAAFRGTSVPPHIEAWFCVAATAASAKGEQVFAGPLAPLRESHMRWLKHFIALGALACAASCASAVADAAPHSAFATSTTGTGDLHSWSEVAGTSLTGLAAADGICRTRAGAGGLADPDTYVAWLSDRDNDAYCRVFGLAGKKANLCGLLLFLPTGAGPWLRTDGVPFADVIENALGANVVYSTLNVDEAGHRFVSDAESFTATDIDGTFNTNLDSGADCAHWTSASADLPIPALGSNMSAGGDWTFDGHGASCSP